MTEEQLMAQKCLDLVDWESTEFVETKHALSARHIQDILEQVYYGKVTGAKANRFIGWAQAALCAEDFLTLNTAREMNRQVIEEAKKLDNSKFNWEIYHKGEYIGTALTHERHDVLRKALGEEAFKIGPGDIEFRLVDLGIEESK